MTRKYMSRLEILYVQYLAKYNDAFDGTNSAIFIENNG